MAGASPEKFYRLSDFDRKHKNGKKRQIAI
jgi:hypothetical protein